MLNREVLDATLGFPSSSEIKNLSASAGAAGDRSLIHQSGRFPGGGNGSPLQYSCLESPMDGGAWWATVHGVAKSWIRLKQRNICIHMVVIAGKWLRLGKGLCLAGPKTMRNFML